MSYLVRKISRSKWQGCGDSIEQAISADAATNCLKTTKNTLSVWFAEQEADIANAKLALLAALERFDAVDVVVLEVESLIAQELHLQETDGLTAAKSLANLHRDISTLTLVELEKVAKLVQAKIVAKQTERIMRGNFQKIIKAAVADGVIDMADLPPKMAADMA